MPSLACSSTGNSSAPDFAPPLRDDPPVRDDVDEAETSRDSLLGTLVGPSALRRALSIVPVAIIGYAIAWFLYFEPSQNVTAKPVVEMKPEVTQVAVPSEPAPAARPEVAEAKPAPAPRRDAARCAGCGCRRAATALVEGRDQGAAGQARRGRFHCRADRWSRRAADRGRPAPLRPVAPPRQARGDAGDAASVALGNPGQPVAQITTRSQRCG